jgi:IS5 family transposase
MIEAVRRDLEQGLKNPGTGRNGLTPQQVLRSLILKRVTNWDFRELRERIADGYTLRQFTDFYCQPVPKHDAFNRAFNRLTPKTLQAVMKQPILSTSCGRKYPICDFRRAVPQNGTSLAAFI